MLIQTTTFYFNLEEDVESIQKRNNLKGMLIGRSKAPKARAKFRTRLKNMNKTPYQTNTQKEKHKEVKRRIRESKAKHNKMYSS